MELSSEKGASSWLSVLPINDHDFALHKGAFHDATCLRYNWHPPHLPSHCVCMWQLFQHRSQALTCLTDGFPSVRHNELEDFRGLSQCVYRTSIAALTGELLCYHMTLQLQKMVVVLMSVHKAFEGDRHQRASIDVRVFHPYAPSYRKMHERTKVYGK